jgi:hypothetical protein
MEPFKEIVNIDEYFFFKGLANFKYYGKKEKLKSHNLNEEHYKHIDYYEVEINKVEKFNSANEFLKWVPKFELNPIRDNQVVIHFNENQFGVKVDKIYIDESLNLNHHVQVEEDFLHGDFYRVPVAFKMHKRTEKVICKPNCFTGITKDNGKYLQITTGNFEADGETCEMIWVKEPNLKSQINTEPSNSSDNNIITEPKGNESNNNDIQTPASFGDYTTNITTPIYTNLENNKGCLNTIYFILAIIWAGLCSYWAVIYGSFLPVLFGVGIPLLLIGFGYFTSLLGRYSTFIGRLFDWLIKLFIGIIIFFILKGLITFFTHYNWSNNSIRDKDWDKQEIIDPDKQGQDNFIDNDNGRKIQRDKIIVQLMWKDFDNHKYEGKYYIYKDDIAKSSDNLNNLKSLNLDKFGYIYSNIYQSDKNSLNGVYEMLDKIRVSQKLDKVEFANTIVSMVQSIDYVLILEAGCTDPVVLQNRQVQQMINSGISCDGYAPYGLKTPTQFLSDLKGDCDSRTLLLFSIFKHYNYKVAIINSEIYEHSMLGLDLPGASGMYKPYNGVRYYFWETTNKGFKIGEIPKENGNLNYWKIELN